MGLELYQIIWFMPFQLFAALFLCYLRPSLDMVTCLNNWEIAFLFLSPRPIKILQILSYRPISLASALSKALEWCILLQYPEYFTTSGLQFGFKERMSTTLCTGTVKNVISRYMHEGSSVFACFLDASKAFDLVNHEILFNRLLERNFPVHLTRFFLTWYKDQRMCVRWKNAFSDSFPISNGVRQGGVLSPILFTIYIDDLLDNLRNCGVGCF